MTEIMISSLILGLSIILLLLTPGQVAKRLLGRRDIPFPPYSVPLIALSVIALLSAGWLVRTCILKNDSMNETAFLFDKSKVRVIITLIILLLGDCALNVVGFIPTTAITTGLLLAYFGVKNWKVILTLAVATPLFIYIFFEVALKTPLP